MRDADSSGRPDHMPRAFTWMGVTYRVRVISTWHLRDRWWDRAAHSDRYYCRVLTPDQQVFEPYLTFRTGLC